MNILILSACPKSLVNFRLQLIKSLIKQNNSVFVFAPNINQDFEIRTKLLKLGVSIIDYPLKNRSFNIYSDFQALFIISYNLFSLDIDLVYSYSIKPIIYSGLSLRITRFIRKKKIKFYPLITGLGYAFTNPTKGFLKKVIFLFVRFLYKESLKDADCVIFQNPDDQKEFRNLKIIKKLQKTLRVWGSGIDLDEFRPQQLPEKKVFLMISRLLIEKGVNEYIRAAAMVKQRYPNSVFRLIGGFPSNKSSSIDRNNLEKYIRNNIIEYLGEISFLEIKKELSKCRYFVLPSYREGTPRSVLEALGVGRPIITTDVPGCRETVIDGINGKLVKSGDVLDLVEKMELLLNFSDEVIVKMSQESINLARKKYDVNKVNRKILNLIL